MRTRQSQYEIVADGSDEGGTNHCIVLFRERYWLSGIGGRDCGQSLSCVGRERLVARASGFQASKSVGFRRGIPPAVHACYKLFWN